MSYAINHPNGDHLGFVLLVGGPERGDAIVRFLPNKAEHFESAHGKVLAALMDAGEFTWHEIGGSTTAQAQQGNQAFTICDLQLICSDQVFGLVPLKPRT